MAEKEWAPPLFGFRIPVGFRLTMLDLDGGKYQRGSSVVGKQETFCSNTKVRKKCTQCKQAMGNTYWVSNGQKECMICQDVQ